MQRLCHPLQESINELIEASGNRRAIDSYNEAVKGMKARRTRDTNAFVEAYSRTMRERIRAATEEDYGKKMAAYGRKMREK